jgi:hypothetical protein
MIQAVCYNPKRVLKGCYSTIKGHVNDAFANGVEFLSCCNQWVYIPSLSKHLHRLATFRCKELP